MTPGRCCLLFLASLLLLPFPGTGRTGYQFLDIAPSPVQLSLGNAATAFPVGNASRFYSNPALLPLPSAPANIFSPFLRSFDLYFSYIRYFEDVNGISFFSTYEIKSLGYLGLGFTGLLTGDIASTAYDGAAGYVSSGSRSTGFYSFLLGYGLSITEKLSAGINLKLPVEVLGGGTSTGIGADIGAIWKEGDWMFGLALADLGTDLSDSATKQEMDLKARLGISYGFYLFERVYSSDHRLTLGLDPGYARENGLILGFGWQYAYRNTLFFRNGFYNENGRTDMRLGLGLAYSTLRLDYSYDKKELGIIHRIGFGMSFSLDNSGGLEVEQAADRLWTRIGIGSSLLFDYNRSYVKSGAFSMLEKVVRLIDAEKDAQVYIFGYTDSIAGDDYNLELSRARAEAVAAYLTGKGIRKERILLKGFGKKSPVADNLTEEGRAKNRRVEIYLVHLGKKDKKKFDYHFYSGMDLYVKEVFDQAIVEWKRALLLSPENLTVKNWIMKAEQELVKKRMEGRKRK